ncbi:hypothetical protein HK405_008846 [Cladochytrium tenue]|nr:hypothetical protein HK405_008846 [Cladochytrium tenue]
MKAVHTHATDYVLEVVEKNMENGGILLILRGPPGSGVSTILANVASALGGTKLVAAFFCTSSDPTSTDPKVMVLTLLSELCRVSNGFTKKTLDVLRANRDFLANNTAEEIFDKLCAQFETSDSPGDMIISIDTGDCYGVVSSLIRKWRLSLPPTVGILIGASTDTILDNLGNLKPTEIEVKPELGTKDMLVYTKAYLRSCAFENHDLSLNDAAEKLVGLCGNNFTSAVLVEHYVMLVAEPLTVDVLDFLRRDLDSPLSTAEHIVVCIFQAYLDIPSVQPSLLAKVLRTLAAQPRSQAAAATARWTTATLAAKVSEDEPAVAKLLRQLGPLVTFYRGPTAVGAGDGAAGETPVTTVSLVSSLLAASVRKLDELGFFDQDGDRVVNSSALIREFIGGDASLPFEDIEDLRFLETNTLRGNTQRAGNVQELGCHKLELLPDAGISMAAGIPIYPQEPGALRLPHPEVVCDIEYFR